MATAAGKVKTYLERVQLLKRIHLIVESGAETTDKYKERATPEMLAQWKAQLRVLEGFLSGLISSVKLNDNGVASATIDV